MADILAKSPELTKIIKKAVERIGENHALARDNKGVTITNKEIEKERGEITNVIEESLKAVADEMAEKMVLENTIDGMVKDVIEEQGLIWDPESDKLHKQGQRVGETMEDYENRARKEGFNPCDGRAPQFNKWMKEQGRDCKEIREMIKNGTWKGSHTTTTDTKDTTDTSGVQIKWKSCEGNSTHTSWTCVDPQYGSVGAEFRIQVGGKDRKVYVYEVGGSCDINSATVTSPSDGSCPLNESRILENTIDGMVKDAINEQSVDIMNRNKVEAAFDERFWTNFPPMTINPPLFDDNQLRKLWQKFLDLMEGWNVDERALAHMYGTPGKITSIVQASQFSAYYHDRTGQRFEDDLDDAMATYPTEKGWKDAGSGNPPTDVKPLQAIARFLGDVDIQRVYDVIDTLPWGMKTGKEIDESTTEVIKKIVNKKLKDKISEASKVPGLAAYKKSHKKSGQETKAYHTEFKKKMKAYDNFQGNTHPEFPHQESSKTDYDSPMYRGTTDDDEFVEDFAYPGLQDFDAHNQDMERLTDYLEGSSETGNAMTDDDDKALGNVVPSELGKKILKSKKRRKEKIAAQKASMSNLKGITPDVQKVKQVKEAVNSDIDKIKKLWSYNKITQ